MSGIGFTVCECRNAAHRHVGSLTPNGNRGHGPNFSLNPASVVTYRMPFGIFDVCPDCAKDCMAEYEQYVLKT